MSENDPPRSPTGVTDEIIESEIQVHWTARAMRPVRRLYEWMLHWSETKYAGVALGAVAFSEAVWFPLPADPLLIALCLGRPRRSYWYAVSCTFWSTFGAMVAMLAGTFIGQERVLAAMAYIHLDKEAAEALRLFRQYGFWAIAVAALLSFVPYKVFAWTAGFAGVPWYTFLIATVIFRKFRYVLIGALIYAYGVRARNFIEKYFNLVCTIIGAVLVLVLVLIAYRHAIRNLLSGLWGG